MGFHFEEDVPVNEQAERYEEEPGDAWLAPEDDIQGIDIEGDGQQQLGVPRRKTPFWSMVKCLQFRVHWPICVLLVQHMAFRVQEAKQNVSSV